MANQNTARVDREAVFQGTCSTCHAAPSNGKTGLTLYQTVCGICHSAEHRATMESFWGTLKQELVHHQNYATRAAAKQSLFTWIETYYNRVRLHSALGYQSPVDFENHLN